MTEKTKGKWICAYSHPFQGMVIKCSNCNKHIRYEYPNPKYCPECGVSMINYNDKFPANWLKALDTF